MTVVNLDNNQVLATISASALPAPGTLEATVQYGKGVFFSSAEVNQPPRVDPIPEIN